MNDRTLIVDIHDDWHVGSGRGRGRHLDAVVDRDSDSLPYVPGRMLRGLLRDACEYVAGFSGDTARVIQLFGTPSDTPRAQQRAGALAVSDARLGAQERAWLIAEGDSAQAALFREQFRTAIDQATGVALDHSLRGIEVAVPMQLVAQVEIDPARIDVASGWAMLSAALPFVRAVGADRTRGLGRCTLSWGNRTAAPPQSEKVS